MRKGTKLGIAAALGVGVIAVSIIAAATRGSDGVQVRIESVQRRDLVAIVAGTGWIRPHRKVDVQADIMGRITQLSVAEGQPVKRGQILLRIDPLQYEAAVERARAAVSESQAREAQSRANLLQAERAYERTKQLASGEESLVSQQALEEAETQVRVQQELLQAAGFSVAQARAALGEAQDRLSKTVIRAPMDGVITRLNVDEGETAIVGTMNNPGSLLLTVADLSIMEAVVRVDETDVPDIALGDSATIQVDAFPNRRFVGTVTEISHSSVRPPESQTATTGQGQAVDYEVVIQLRDPPPSLRSDLSATADVVTETKSSVLTIPIIALTVRERGDLEALPQEDPAAEAAAAAAEDQPEDVEGVFVVRNGKAEFVPVRIGIAGQEHFEVISGVSEQDSVVAGPYEAIRGLKPGDAVRPMNAGNTSGGQTAARGQGTTGGD